MPFFRNDAVCHPGRVARRAQRLRHPVTHAALVAGLGLFDISQQQEDAFAWGDAGGGLRLGSRLVEILRGQCCLRHGKERFDIVWLQALQPLGALQPVDRRIAAAGADIKLGDLRVRLSLPDGFQNGGGLAQIVFAKIGLGGDKRCRHERLRQFQCGLCIVARTLRVDLELLFRLRGQKHGLQTLGFATLDDVGGLLLVEQADRIVPLAAAAFAFQRRLRGPGQIGRVFRRILGILQRCLMRALAAGLDIEAAKTKLARLGVICHCLEFAARGVILAFDEIGLGFQQMDQGLLIGAEQTLCSRRHLAGQQGIAGTGSDQAGRQCLIAAVPLAGAEVAACGMWGVPQRADHPPQDHNGCDEGGNHGGRHHHAHLYQLPLPFQRQNARTIRQPGEADGDEKDDDDEANDSGHVLPLLACAADGAVQCAVDEILDLNACVQRLLVFGRCRLGGFGKSIPFKGRTLQVAILQLVFHAGDLGIVAFALDIADRAHLDQRHGAVGQPVDNPLIRIGRAKGRQHRIGDIGETTHQFRARRHAGIGEGAQRLDRRIVRRDLGQCVEFREERTAAIDRRLECCRGNGARHFDIVPRLVDLGFCRVKPLCQRRDLVFFRGPLGLQGRKRGLKLRDFCAGVAAGCGGAFQCGKALLKGRRVSGLSFWCLRNLLLQAGDLRLQRGQFRRRTAIG